MNHTLRKNANQIIEEAIASMLDFEKGIVITKYNHVKEKLEGIDCYEAGHPTLDENGVEGTKKALPDGVFPHFLLG